MRSLLHLAAALLLTGAVATHAQIVNPGKMVSPPPRNPAVGHPTPAADYQWLWQYARPSDKTALLADARFNALLKGNLKAPQAFWGMGTPLSEAAKTFLGGDGLVTSINNRNLMITGCVVDHCPQRGMVWLDLGEPNPLIVFSALRWNEQGHTTDEKDAVFTLWIFSNRALEVNALPEVFKDSLRTWSTPGTSCGHSHVGAVVIVDPDGVPHVRTALDVGIYNCIETNSSGLLK